MRLFLILLAALVTASVLGARNALAPSFNASAGEPAIMERLSAAHADQAERYRAAVHDMRGAKFYPGVSVSIRRNGELIWSESIGYADLDPKRPASPRTVFPIGSVSKPLTGATAMRLVERGLIDLDVPITDYAPGLPAAYRNVTLRRLLSHQAGVRHYRLAFTPPVFTENGLNREFASVEDSLELFLHDPLLFAPDQGFEYSTFGYTLASYVFEQATGRPFLDIIADELTGPLGMTATRADRAASRPPERSADYIAALRKLAVLKAPRTNSSYKWAGGGFLSTPDDLTMFGDALLGGDYLSPEGFAEMTAPRRLASGETNPQNYALGWRRGTMSFPTGAETTVDIVHHGGVAIGAECALLLVPDFATSVAVCGNAFTGNSGALIQLAADLARLAETAAAAPPGSPS